MFDKSSIAQRLATKRVLLFSPRSQSRNAFISTLLTEYGDQLIYTRLSDGIEDWEGLAQHLVDDLSNLLDGFKSSAAKSIAKGPEKAGSALAKDIQSYFTDSARSKLHYLLLIDELDRVEQDEDFVTYIRAIIDGLPENLKIGFNARRLTLEAFTADVQDDDVLVVGTENRVNDIVFEKQEGEVKPQLEIYAFGAGHVLVNGRPIESWDGALPRLLFYFFVDRERVTRADIFSTFWPNLNRKEATNVFHVTKRKITECISDCVLDGENYELTRYESGFYVPSDKLVRNYDVGEFESALAEAATAATEEQEAEALNRAIDLYRFPFLMNYDLPWIEERREKLRTMYADALIDMARWHKRRDDYNFALGFYTRALKEMPQREDVYRDTMLMYWKLGRHDDAIAQYELLAEHLNTTVGVSPSRDTAELHKQILADL